MNLDVSDRRIHIVYSVLEESVNARAKSFPVRTDVTLYDILPLFTTK